MNAEAVQAVAEALWAHDPDRVGLCGDHEALCCPAGDAHEFDSRYHHQAEVAVEAAREPIIQDFLERRDMPSVHIENPEDVRPFIERETRKAKAAALREAADEWPGGPTGYAPVPAWWLHERADQIEREGKA